MRSNQFLKTLGLFALSAAALASCGGGTASRSSLKWDVKFYVDEAVYKTVPVADGKTVEKPANPTKSEGYTFDTWYADSALKVEFDFSTKITANWDIFAGFTYDGGGGGGEQSSDSSDSSDSSESTSEDSSQGQSATGHGPAGSTTVSWQLRGDGSLWKADDWSAADAIPLYSNPGSDDKGCVLEITFAVGDKFKVTDGTDWFGWEKVSKATDGEVPNAGVTHFEGADDGMGGQNIRCKQSGTFDIYVNKNGIFWIQQSA